MSQNEKTWEVNGIALLLDLEDADTVERYEKAFEAMSEAEKKIPKDGKASARIRAYCGIFRDLFKAIFGEENTEKLCAGMPVSAAAYEDLYDQFLAFVQAQQIHIAERRAERMSKYLPNRAQKRAAIKQTRKK